MLDVAIIFVFDLVMDSLVFIFIRIFEMNELRSERLCDDEVSREIFVAFFIIFLEGILMLIFRIILSA
jgi:hypothetical protein